MAANMTVLVGPNGGPAGNDQSLQKNMADLMLGGDFVDFAIQASSYKFRVHMLVLATKSGYFQALLAGGAKWKESDNACVKMDDISPVIIARLIEWMYFGVVLEGRQGGRVISILQNVHLEINALVKPTAEEVRDELSEDAFITVIKLYVVADRLEIPELMEQCRSGLKERIMNGMNLHNFVIAIGLLYQHTNEDDPLRGMVVYLAQMARKQLMKLVPFTTLLTTKGDFCLDFATKYACHNWVYCPTCDSDVDLVECTCGFNRLCGYKVCSEENWAALRCTGCKFAGHLLREAPEDKGVMIGMTVVEASAPGALAAPVTPKRRLSP